MEKYRKFTDPGTGINPFVPYQAPQNTLQGSSLPSTSSAILSWMYTLLLRPLLHLLQAVLVLLRLFLLVIIAALHAVLLLVVVLPTQMLPNAASRRLVKSVDTVIYYSALWVSGLVRISGHPWPFFPIPTNAFAYTPHHPEGSRTTGQAPAPLPSCQPTTPLRLIVSNHCSYLDVIYYLARYSPQFAFPVFLTTHSASTTVKSAIGGDLLVYSLNYRQAVRYSARFSGSPSTLPTPSAKRAIPLGQLLESSRRPVVLFFEGATTNGRAMLKCPETVVGQLGMGWSDELKKKVGVQVHVLKYSTRQPPLLPPLSLQSRSFVSPCHIFGSLVSHFLHLLSLSHFSLTVITLRPTEIPAIGTPTGSHRTWLEAVRYKMATAGQLKELELTMEDKKAFYQKYWEDTAANQLASLSKKE